MSYFWALFVHAFLGNFKLHIGKILYKGKMKELFYFFILITTVYDKNRWELKSAICSSAQNMTSFCRTCYVMKILLGIWLYVAFFYRKKWNNLFPYNFGDVNTIYSIYISHDNSWTYTYNLSNYDRKHLKKKCFLHDLCSK